MLIEEKVTTFLDEVASDSPAPGGGSVAALIGALGASLAAMVARLTIGKEGYEEVWELFKRNLHKFEEIREELTKNIEQDTKAFNRLVNAFKMPKKTKEQKKKRSERIQKGYKNAAQIPLETAKKARRLIDLLDEIGLKGNENALSDIAVGTLCALSALKSAVINVKINLTAIEDDQFVNQCQNELEDLLEGAEKKAFQLEEKITRRITTN